MINIHIHVASWNHGNHDVSRYAVKSFHGTTQSDENLEVQRSTSAESNSNIIIVIVIIIIFKF